MEINHKIKLLQAFWDLTNDIEHSLEHESYEEMMEHLEQRERLIERITRLNEERINQKVSGEEEEQKLLKRIYERNRLIELRIQQKKDEVAQQLRKINASKRANVSYQGTQYSKEGYFIDQTIGSD
jgi:hypothetical protein